jgi:predicted naringenin-chalcone synthase
MSSKIWQPVERHDYGLAAAFGPGFSAEVLLLQWT